jgi:predicted secreted protein
MKTKRITVKMILEKTKTGFSAYSEKYPVFTTGRTIYELTENAFEAASLFFENEKTKLNQEDIKFEIDFQQFFKYYRVINSKFLAEKIGMNPSLLSQYIQGRKRPSESQTGKILTGIHEIGQELSDISLIYNKK